MRASTMFAMIVAILLGLGVAVAAKATGFLNRSEPKKEPPPRMVLAAARNIFDGYCLQANDVKLRPIRPDEEAAFKKGDLLPPMTQAAARRFAKVSIPADVAIRKEHLEDLNAPAALKDRLHPGMRAVNVSTHKSHCAGGMISVGDWVDVQLVTTVEGAEAMRNTNNNSQKKGPPPITASAVIVKNVRVIAKRNSLWPVPTPLGPDCAVNFTLETNPYRAGLIEYVKDKGVISLLPVSDTDKRALEAKRNEALNNNANGLVQVSHVIPDSTEYHDEDVRVAAYTKGEYSIGEPDLMRIFKLRPPVVPPPPPPPFTINRIVGVQPVGQHVYQSEGSAPAEGEVQEGTTPAPGNGPRSMVAPRQSPGKTRQGGSDSYRTYVASASPTLGGSSSPYRFRPPESSCNKISNSAKKK
jgi:Flp pilus assembly protein CpaB